MFLRAAAVAWLVSASAYAAEEEVNLDELEAAEGPRPAGTAPKVVPEHDYDKRLLAFPVLLVLILAWNVKWKPEPKKAAR